MIIDLQGGHPGANFHDHPGAFMTADARRLAGDASEIAGHDVLVAVAHTAGGQLHQHLASLRWIEVDLLDAPWRVAFPQNRGLCLHSTTPSVRTS